MPRSFTEDQNWWCSYKRTKVQNEMFRKSQSSSTQGKSREVNGPHTVLSHPYTTVSWHRVHNCGINIPTSFPALSRQDGDSWVPPCPPPTPCAQAGPAACQRHVWDQGWAAGLALTHSPMAPHWPQPPHGLLAAQKVTALHRDSFRNNLFSHILLKEKCSA